MELWFIYALLSAFFAGIFTFGLKIIAEKNLDGNLLTGMYLGTSSVIAMVILFFTKEVDFNNLSLYKNSLFFGGLSGVLISILYVIQIKTLKYIDTTLYYPIYKTLGPIFVAIIGIFYFKESLTNFEYIAMATSITIPLLLIDKKEKSRQNNLKRGLSLILLTAVIGSVTVLVEKMAVDNGTIWLVIAAKDFLVY